MNFVFAGCSVLLAVATAVAVPLEAKLSDQHHHYGNGLNRDIYSPYGQYYQPYGYGYYGNHGGYPNTYYQDYDGDGIADNVDDYNNGYEGYGYPYLGRYVQQPLQHGYGSSYGSPRYYRK